MHPITWQKSCSHRNWNGKRAGASDNLKKAEWQKSILGKGWDQNLQKGRRMPKTRHHIFLLHWLRLSDCTFWSKILRQFCNNKHQFFYKSFISFPPFWAFSGFLWQAAAKQRAGRAGRTGPGKTYRLFTERAYRYCHTCFVRPHKYIMWYPSQGWDAANSSARNPAN